MARVATVPRIMVLNHDSPVETFKNSRNDTAKPAGKEMRPSFVSPATAQSPSWSGGTALTVLAARSTASETGAPGVALSWRRAEVTSDEGASTAEDADVGTAVAVVACSVTGAGGAAVVGADASARGAG